MSLSKNKVFISHNSKDKDFVRRLSTDLKEHGVAFWLDEIEMGVGDSLIEKIQAGISQAKYFLIVLSKDSVNSNWVRKELNTALSMEINTGNNFILPAVIDDCEVPPFLYEKIYADFRNGYEIGLLHLLKTLVGKKRLQEVVKIPSGEFLYSSKNVMRKISKSFYIDKIGVTLGGFYRFIEETGYQHPYFAAGDPPLSTDALLPVNCVNLEDAINYCKWRGQVEGSRVRLPTSEEWEKAARGVDGRNYPWGDEGDLASQFWYCNCQEFVDLENRGNKVRQPWDRFPHNVSPFGVRDMSGNVFEWTSSGFQGSHVVEQQPGAGQEIRGGAFVLPLAVAQCHSRMPRIERDRCEYIGFRCLTEI